MFNLIKLGVKLDLGRTSLQANRNGLCSDDIGRNANTSSFAFDLSVCHQSSNHYTRRSLYWGTLSFVVKNIIALLDESSFVIAVGCRMYRRCFSIVVIVVTLVLFVSFTLVSSYSLSCVRPCVSFLRTLFFVCGWYVFVCGRTNNFVMSNLSKRNLDQHDEFSSIPSYMYEK